MAFNLYIFSGVIKGNGVNEIQEGYRTGTGRVQMGNSRGTVGVQEGYRTGTGGKQ